MEHIDLIATAEMVRTYATALERREWRDGINSFISVFLGIRNNMRACHMGAQLAESSMVGRGLVEL